MYSIVEKNNDFLLVSKPQGVSIHSEGNQPGFIVQLKQQCNLSELYPVHRLDKVTSGLLICACHHKAASDLSQLFQQRRIEKYYLAISDKKPKKKQGLITGDMKKSRRSSWKLCQTRENPAVTRFFSQHVYGKHRLFILKPYTGKTHQLRVALKSISAPICGDLLYGGTVQKSDGILLHACGLAFQYQGREYKYALLPRHWPSDFQSWLRVDADNRQVVTEPWSLPWPER